MNRLSNPNKKVLLNLPWTPMLVRIETRKNHRSLADIQRLIDLDFNDECDLNHPKVVENNMTDRNWAESAYDVVRKVAESKSEFTPDDIWATGLEKPVEARALGGVMRRASQAKIIEKTGRVQPTTQPESHGTDITVWRSLIFRPA